MWDQLTHFEKKKHSALHEHQHSLLSSYLTNFEKYVFV